ASCGTNGVKKSSDEAAGAPSLFLNNTEHAASPAMSPEHQHEEDAESPDKGEKNESDVAASFVFGQNIKDRAKLEENSTEDKSKDGSQETEGTNYFLQYISTPSSKNSTNNADSGTKFVFGQNMSERVLSPPKGASAAEENSATSGPPASEPVPQEVA
ncbi:hypothetical protein CRUP_015986, partial [Coryphaenoides rupestris]